MTLSDLASIGSFISGAAVVFSFVFLALQMRQANLNQRALMQQGRTARTLEAFSRMVDPYISGLTVRAQMRADLDSVEVNSIIRVVGLWFWNYEDSFLQFRSGTLDSTSWESDVEALKVMLSDASCRVSWQMMRNYMGSSFRDYVDNLMRETKTSQIPDYAEQWKTLMRAERAAA